MRILVIDEDTRSVPHICDEMRQLGHQIEQVTGWEDLAGVITRFRPEAIILDLMMPAVKLPRAECGGGYTTGAYIYAKFVQPIAPNVPFVVFSSAFFESTVIKHALQQLAKYREFRRAFSKGDEVEDILAALKTKP